jgi:hypothetical protein
MAQSGPSVDRVARSASGGMAEMPNPRVECLLITQNGRRRNRTYDAVNNASQERGTSFGHVTASRHLRLLDIAIGVQSVDPLAPDIEYAPNAPADGNRPAVVAVGLPVCRD